MSKTVVEYVDPKTLHRDINQPRQPDWESDEVQEELQKLADSYHGDPENQIWQIKIDEDNAVRLGERRWRAALMVNLPTVKVERVEGLSELEWFHLQMEDDEYKILHTELDKAWAFGLRVVRINTGDDSISLEQLKEMDQKTQLNLIEISKEEGPTKHAESGTQKLARDLKMNQTTIWNYIQVLYLEPETQAKIGRRNGQIPYTYARVVTRLYPDHLDEKSKVEEFLREGKFSTREELENYVDKYFEKLQIKAEERAKEIEKELEEKPLEVPKEDKPEKKPKKEKPEPSEPSEEVVESEAGKIARELRETREKVLNSLYAVDGKGNSLEGKIAFAEKEGVDPSLVESWTVEFTKFAEQDYRDGDYVKEELLEGYDQIHEVIKEVDKNRKELKKQKERERIEEEERERLREEVREELKEDEEFREEVAEEQAEKEREKLREDMKEVVGDLGEPVSDDELREYEEARQAYYDSLERVLSSEVVRKRGKLFRNWWNHASITGIVGELTCPECGSPSGNLTWRCHPDLTIEDATEIARRKYQESLEED